MAIVLPRLRCSRSPEMGKLATVPFNCPSCNSSYRLALPESRVSPANATLNASFAAVRFRNGKDIPSLSISRLSNPASVAARAFKAR